MLRDEVVRSAVIVYCFDDPADEGARTALTALAARHGSIPGPVEIFAVSPAPMEALKSLQKELGLPFPLLRDDRGLMAAYGVERAEEEAAEPVLAVVDRQQRLAWYRRPAGAVDVAWPEVVACVERMKPPTSNYPRTVVNRLVAWRSR
jgi:peroxiredoxin